VWDFLPTDPFVAIDYSYLISNVVFYLCGHSHIFVHGEILCIYSLMEDAVHKYIHRYM
jgi:hypothetical protein